MASRFHYDTIGLEGFELIFEAADRGQAECRLKIAPYSILRWSDLILVNAHMEFVGSPRRTQRLEARGMDEFGQCDFTELQSVLESLQKGQPAAMRLHGAEQACSADFVLNRDRVELVGEIGHPYLRHQLIFNPALAHRRGGNTFVGGCVFSFALDPQSLVQPIAELARFNAHLTSLQSPKQP